MKIETEEEKEQPKKKHIIIKILIVLIILFVLIFLYSRYYEVKNIKVKEYNISSNELPDSFDGVKIIHFSDLNYGSTIKEEELTKIVDMMNELKPDMVIFTGNLFYENYDYTKEDMDFIVSSFSKIESIIGKYAVKGVNDNRVEDYNIHLSNAGFTVLDNSYDLVYYKGFTPIYLTGLSSYLTTKIDLSSAFKYYEDKDKDENEENIYEPVYKIVLVNESDAVDEIINYRSDINLILSGNSLGGIIKIPYYGSLMTFPGSEKYKNDYYLKDNTSIYVSSGLGTNSLKLRLNNSPSFNFYRLSHVD